MSKTIFITGANRGVGLAFVRQYAAAGDMVIATCRYPEQADALQALAAKNKQVTIAPLDIASEESVAAIAKRCSGQAIDLLINNAGVMNRGRGGIGPWDKPGMLAHLETNFFGTLSLTSHLLPNVLQSTSRQIVTITTKVSSIADNRSGGNYGYRCSKIALNMAMKNIAIDYHDQGMHVLLLHPGWVQTEMGGPSSLISTDESVTGMRQVIDDKADESFAGFYDYQGNIIPW